jgi:hypothetical protein
MNLAAIAACAALCLHLVRGFVLYEHPGSGPAALEQRQTIELADQDTATTGDRSLARIDFPDRSDVLVGADSKLQLILAHEIAQTGARLSIANGIVRFVVRPSSSGNVRYTFETPSASIAVPPGRGDIAVRNSGTLQVNVYDVCDRRTPVEVQTTDGVVYQLLAGQSLVARLVGGTLQAHVEALSESLVETFLPAFGTPPGWASSAAHVIQMQEAPPQSTPAGVPTPFAAIATAPPFTPPATVPHVEPSATRSSWCTQRQ